MSEEPHPLLSLDTSEFAKNFNLSAFLGKIALGVGTALVIGYIVPKIREFIESGRKNKS